MLEIKSDESEIVKDNNNLVEAIKEETDAPQEETTTTVASEAAAAAETVENAEAAATTTTEINAQAQQPESEAPQIDCNETTMLNPLNDPEPHIDTESKGKQRRYWTPKEEERFFLIWGRDNWRLTRHGKNTVFFAQWSEELKERFNIDVKPEEVQCKVNQTRAKFRSVRKLIESGSNCQKWKKYDLVGKILRNQYRSKDDEPVPLDALENNRDVSPTELLNCETRASSPNIAELTTEPDINLSQTAGDPQLADEVNMSNISLSENNLASHVFSNNSHSNTSFSTELFGGDQLEIKKENENNLMNEGFPEFIPIRPNEQQTLADNAINNTTVPSQETQNPQLFNQEPNTMVQTNLLDISNNMDIQQQVATNNNHAINTNNSALHNNTLQNHQAPIQNNFDTTIASTLNHQNHAAIPNNHIVASTMQPPKNTVPPTPSPRKRSAKSAQNVTTLTQDVLENLYLEEVKKKNVILVEQGEINRKRLRLEERKVKLMEEFFPKYLTLQQEILQKLENVASGAAEASMNDKKEE